MASHLENYVTKVQNLTLTSSLRELAEMHHADTIELLAKNWSVLDNLLETLDMHEHTLSIIYVLIAKLRSISMSNAEPYQTVGLFKQFIHACKGEHARFVAHSFYEMCHMFANYVVDLPICVLGVDILAKAIPKIQTYPSQLTPVHADLLMLSLKVKYFKRTIRYLVIDVTTISTASETRGHNNHDSNNDSKYFLQFYYYGGMICTALKDHARALYFFEVCISTPAMAMSHIMLQAYKKFILVSLILHGKIKSIPKYSWQVITRFMKPLSQVYHDLATAYATSSSESLNLIIAKYTDVFVRDHNMGLVKQVAKALVKKNIKRLTKTFLTLSLSDVATRVQLRNSAEAEKFILNMIKSHEIYASINQKDGMVVFRDNPQRFNTPQMFGRLKKDMKRVMGLVKMINEMEEDIVLNPVYIKKVMGTGDEEVPNAKPYASDPMD